MKECRFRIGDRVDISTKIDFSGGQFKAERILLQVMFATESMQRWLVIFKSFDKGINSWMVWIESRAGEVHRFKERLLINRAENLTPTKTAIEKGKTAREILGLRQETHPEPKKYYRVIFKEDGTIENQGRADLP